MARVKFAQTMEPLATSARADLCFQMVNALPNAYLAISSYQANATNA